MSEAVVRWDTTQGMLVGPDGQLVTSAQEAKARAYVARGLIKWTRTIERVRGERVVNEYLVGPLPSCRIQQTVRHTTTIQEGRMLHAMTCGCQAFRGTRKAGPRVCSHILAVRRLIL